MFFENIKIKKQNTTNTMRRNGGFLGYGQNDDDNKKGEGENFERLPNFEIKQQEHIDKLLGRGDQSAIVRVRLK
uniref:Uncharacterized protein n=1 Tax=Meloidogyne incognita TaxID=6306 RepID=A0A914LTH5_MELIC